MSENLATLNSLIVSLRAKLDSYKQELQATAQELKQSEARLVKAENESNTFILTLKKQEATLTEQSKSLQSAKASLKRLRRKDKAKDILIYVDYRWACGLSLTDKIKAGVVMPRLFAIRELR